MVIMKKWLTVFCILLFTGLFGMNVFAQEEGKTVVALGADLTKQQKDTVLELMGITEEQLAGYDVVYVTNDQEHQYLDEYLSSSIIGSKSLSSVILRKGAAGSGVIVTTKNINYCTTGMYRNALLTAGVEDTEVLVAGPSQISGTAALIGAVKAYEKMEGINISDTSLSNALDELIITGEISQSAENGDGDEVEKLIAYIKEKIANGELETDEDIREAVKEGEERFGVKLTEEEVGRIIDLMKKLENMGLNSAYLISQAEKLYNKYGTDIVNHADDAISEALHDAFSNAVSDFFQSIGNSIKDFFTGIFK